MTVTTYHYYFYENSRCFTTDRPNPYHSNTRTKPQNIINQLSFTDRYVKMNMFGHEYNDTNEQLWIMNGNTIHNYTATVHFLAEYTTAHVNFGMEMMQLG